jgi:tRNA pseudouridine55 synthase
MTPVAHCVSELHGVLLLDKALGVTSNRALQSVRQLYGRAKAGHTGTLDPLATGLLPICLGDATKFAQGMLDAAKGYDAILKLGFTSTTGDLEGEIAGSSKADLSVQDIQVVLDQFRGPIYQRPPMHSALKLRGRPLYEYARQGIAVERALRPVEITKLELNQLHGDELTISVSCSKGTYIRVLAEDIGQVLGCGAYLKALRRTSTGQFELSSAHTLEFLAGLSLVERVNLLVPVDALLQDVPLLHLNGEHAFRLQQGQAVDSDEARRPGRYRLYGDTGTFLGIGTVTEDRRVRPSRLIAATNTNYLKSLENNP